MNGYSLLIPFAWALNGLLVLLYAMLNHWLSVLLLPALAWLVIKGPVEHQKWGWGIAALALVVSVFAQPPAPLLLLVMALAAAMAIPIEKFNPVNLHWRMISGIALYSLIGAGVSAFQFYLENTATNNLMFTQGQTYLGIMAAIGLYGYPLGYLALLAQALFVHPPIPGGSSRPEDLVHALRARKED